MCKSEIKRGKAAPEQDMKTNFETVAGGESTREGLGDRLLIKFVLLLEVPDDLSDHGVGVAHKAEAVLQ